MTVCHTYILQIFIIYRQCTYDKNKLSVGKIHIKCNNIITHQLPNIPNFNIQV